MSDNREPLEEYIDKKVTIQGRIQKFRTRLKEVGRNGGCYIQQDTVCLEDIKFLDGTPVCQHLWFYKTERVA